MKSVLAGCAALLSACAGAACAAPSAIRPFHGVCTAGSYIAQGGTAEEVRNNRSRFSCDSMMISATPDDPKRLTIRFWATHGREVRSLAFAGQLGEGDLIDVRTAYLEPDAPLGVEQGNCQFSLTRGAIRVVTCVAKLAERDRRTIAIVVFETRQPYPHLAP